MWASYFSLAIGGGTAVGQVVAGLLAGSWRLPFILVAVGSSCSYLLVLAVAVEPLRGGADTISISDMERTDTQDADSYGNTPPDTFWKSVKQLQSQLRVVLSVETNTLVFLQALFGTVPWAVISVYLPDFLAQEKGFSVQGATFLVLFFGLGAIGGGVAGGVLGGVLYRNHPSILPLVIGICQSCSAGPLLFLLNSSLLYTPSSGASPAIRPIVYAVAVLGGMLAAVTGPNIKAMLLNCNAPSHRASVLSFAYVFDSLAKGMAPAVVGLVVGLVGARQAVFSCAMIGWVVSGLIIIRMGRSLRRDERLASGRAERQDEDELSIEVEKAT
jgi:sugar phosphate permease